MFYFDNVNHKSWPYDQYYISKMIYDYRDNFIVFIPDILNTPYGSVLRHNWWKDHKLFYDLYQLLDVNQPWKEPSEKLDHSSKLDVHPWPNTEVYGYEYW